MKKKVMILFFASAILTSALTGCGCGRGNTGGNTNDNTNINGTEEITQEEFGTETINDTENAGSLIRSLEVLWRSHRDLTDSLQKQNRMDS